MSDSSNRANLASLIFSQREGLTPLPTPLKLQELSDEVRAYLWAVFYASLERYTKYPDFGGHPYLQNPWAEILKKWHVYYLHRPLDEYSNNSKLHVEGLKQVILKQSYAAVFDLVEFVLRSGLAPYGLAEAIGAALRQGRAAYVVANGKAIVPAATPEEATAIQKAFAELERAKLGGARTHLLNAAGMINKGDYAGSVRESIHAVESVARLLSPGTNTLGPALSVLEKNGRIHPALKGGWEKLYGFTSDEEGIRHALLEKDAAEVDQVDALFMFGACASFVSLLVNRGRAVGIEI